MAERRGPRLKGVYAARTTETPQPKFEYFLRRFGKSLAAAATVRDIASTHITLLESLGVKDQFYSFGFDPQDVKSFSRRMQQRIDKSGHNKSPMKVKTDPEEPLRWVGCIGLDSEPIQTSDGQYLRPHKLAVGLVLDDRLQDQRGIIEEGLTEEFGELPEMRRFSPHITIGNIHWPWREQYCQQEAVDLLPKNLAVPKTIALNGLAVYLDRIHGPHGAVVA